MRLYIGSTLVSRFIALAAYRLQSPTLRPEYICIIVLQELLYTASLPELLAQFLTTVTQQLVDKASSYPYAPDLLHKPILTACPCLNRLTRASILSGYTDSVIDKVLILPLRQVHQKLKPSEGIRFLESSIAAIIYYTL